MLKINLSDEVLAEIGKITVVFSLIEDSLAQIIGKIVTVGGRPRKLGTIVTAELSFRQLVAILDSLLLFALGKDNEFVAEFARVKPKLFQGEQERNVVVHSVWANQSGSVDPHAIVRMKATAKQKKGLRADFIEMGLQDLRRITDVLGEAFGQLSLFELHFHEEAHSFESSSKDDGGCENPEA